jgi:hypothetical protein
MTRDPLRLGDAISYLASEARLVSGHQPGNLGTSLLIGSSTRRLSNSPLTSRAHRGWGANHRKGDSARRLPRPPRS